MTILYVIYWIVSIDQKAYFQIFMLNLDSNLPYAQSINIGSFQFYMIFTKFKLHPARYHAIIHLIVYSAVYKFGFREERFMATIKDIAQLAGVSHGTVSNVLNGRGNVSMQKILQVEQAARQLGYSMDERARWLRQNRDYSIGIVLPDLQSDCFTALYSTISAYMQRAGYHAFLYLTGDIPDQEEAALAELAGTKVAVVVLVTCQSQGSEARRLLQKSGAQLVCLVRPTEQTDALICFDTQRIARQAVARLSGHRPAHISVISGLLVHRNEAEFIDALKTELGGAIPIQCYHTDMANADIAAFSCVSAEPKPDVVFTSSPVFAQKLLNACAYRHDKPPLIVSIAPAELIESADPIERICLDYKAMALHACAIMTGREKPAFIRIPPREPAAQFEWRMTGAKGTHLNVLMIDGPDTRALQKLLPDFSRHTGIEVTLAALPYADMYQTACMMGDSGLYDVLRLDAAWLSSIAPRLLRPFDPDSETVQSIWQPMLEGVRAPFSLVDQQVYAFPFTPNVQLHFYRKDLFDDSKIRRLYYESRHRQLDVPKDYEQYCDLLRFFDRSINPLSPLEYGAAIASNSIDCISGEFLPCYFSMHGKLFDAKDRPCLRSEAGQKALRCYAEMHAHSQRISGSNSLWSGSVDCFTRGDTAMLNMFINHVYGIKNLRKSKIAGQIGFCSVPGKTPLMGGGVMGVARASKKQDAALEFIRWACSEQIAVPFTLLGGISPCRSIYENQELLELYPWLSIVPENLALSAERRVPKGINEHTVETIIGIAVRNMITGICTPEMALDQMQLQLETLCENG